MNVMNFINKNLIKKLKTLNPNYHHPFNHTSPNPQNLITKELNQTLYLTLTTQINNNINNNNNNNNNINQLCLLNVLINKN